VKAMSRQALTATAMLAALAGSSGVAEAQTRPGQGPGPDTPKILVPTFRIQGATQERGLGVQGADAIRNRVSQEFTARQLWAISKNDINETLKASGYNPDSALSPSDIKELAKIMRADEIIDGEVEKLADGQVKVTARMLLARDVNLSQPLGTVTAKNVGDAAKPIAAELEQARKQLKDNRECENAIRNSKFDEAIAAAQKGISAYPKATLARLCLASALSAKKAPAADVIKAADEVLAIDPLSRIALGLKYGAQKESGDKSGSVATLQAMAKADPTNTTLQGQIASELAQLEPKEALVSIEKLLEANPGDLEMTRLLWATASRAGDYKKFMSVGEELVKLDTAVADTTFFVRMVAAAASDSNNAKAAEYASRAVQKFPGNANLLALQSQTLRKIGQLPQSVAAMQKAVEADPKVENGYLLIVVGFSEMNQPDSAKAWAQKAIAAGSNSEQIGNALLAPVQAAFQKAQASKARADWREALTAAQAAHEVAKTKNSHFFVGVASFQVGLDAVQKLNQSKSCAEVNLVEEMFTITQTELPPGGSVDANTAGQILGVVNQVLPSIPQYKKALCTKGGK